MGLADTIGAAAADRDVAEFRGELRAHGRVLGALRETQVEQGQAIAELRDEMRDGFGQLRAGMEQIAQLLEALIPGDIAG